MRHVLTAIAAVAVCGFIATTSVRAEPSHDLGGPVTAGNSCWVSASSNDQGYWKDCPKPVKIKRKK